MMILLGIFFMATLVAFSGVGGDYGEVCLAVGMVCLVISAFLGILVEGKGRK